MIKKGDYFKKIFNNLDIKIFFLKGINLDQIKENKSITLVDLLS